MNAGHDLGPVVVSTCLQGGGAPIIDQGTTRTDRGRELDAFVLLPPRLWRTPKAERPAARALVVATIGRPWGRYFNTRYAVNRRVDRAAQAIAHRLPRRVRVWAVVDAAVRAREPECRPGGGYCGPDGLTYKDLHDAAAGTTPQVSA